MTVASALAFLGAVLGVAGMSTLRPRRAGERRTIQAVVPRIAAALPARLRPPLDLPARIDAAGCPGGLGAGEVMAVKAAAAFAALPLGSVFGALMPGRLGVLVTVAAPAAGFLAPDLWLARRARERISAARRDLPALLDLLGVATDAGLSPARALGAVGERSESLVAAEWAGVARQIEVGVPLGRALETLNRRLPAPELRAFTTALERTAVHGAALSDTVAAQARDARAARRRRIEEQAAKASPKIQLVVALLLVPSVLLVVAAALGSALIGGEVGAAISD